MSRYLLARHCFACEAGDHAVFLDLKQDKYVAIEPDDLGFIRSVVRGWPSATREANVDLSRHSELEQKLLDQGLLTRSEVCGKEASAPGVVPATISIGDFEDPSRRFSARHHSTFILAWLTTSLRLSITPLRQSVKRLEERKQRVHPDDPRMDVERSVALSQAYLSIRPRFFSSEDACLRDSLTLVEFLAMNNQRATLVFGVRMSPFAAHCWVQHKSIVLNDHVSHVQRYVPIMAV